LTGLRVKVLWHPDPGIRGLEGLVLLETDRSLLIATDSGRKVRILKEGSLLSVEAPGLGYIRVRGEEVLGDPLERVKLYRWVSSRARYEGG